MSEQAILTNRRGENVSQSEIIRKNRSAIDASQREEERRRTLSTRTSDAITAFAGSMFFVWMHAFWFGLWILLNVGLVHVPRVSEFDPFPFGLLTMIVSLEAIFLSTFVLISQNRMARLSEQRAELDLHVNLLAEQKATKALEMLDKISRQLNQGSRFELPRDPEVEALKVSPDPQEVLKVLKDAVDDKAEDLKRDVDKVMNEITGEMEAVREDVETTGEEVRRTVGRIEEKVDGVADEVDELKARTTAEHDKLSLG